MRNVPELADCVLSNNGKTYCVDRKTGEIVEVKIEIVPFVQVPQDAVKAILKKRKP